MFYNKEDLWSVPVRPVDGQERARSPDPLHTLYVEPLYIAAEKGQLHELKRVIVGFGDRIAMEETLDGAIARVFGGPTPRAGTEVAPSPPVGAEGSVKSPGSFQ